MFQLNYLLHTFGNLHYNHLYILLFKVSIYLISILQHACICFHGNGRKEVNLIHVFTIYKTWRPLSSIGSMQICHRPNTIGKTCLKITKTILVIYLATPPTFTVYKCYNINLNLLILLESY